MARMLCAEIGRSLIKICEMEYKVKNPKIYFLTEVETPENCILDGYLIPAGQERLREVIRSVLASNRIKTKKIAFTVVSGKIINREVTLPAVKRSMISDVIQTNLTEYFPVDLSEYETTYSLLETYKEGPDAGKHRVMISAMEKVMIEQYKALAESCGLSLLNLYYGGDSVLQAVRDESDGETWAVVKVEDHYSVITVLKNGQLMLQRSIPYGVGEAIEVIINKEDNKLDSYLEVWQLCSRENMNRISEYKEVLGGVVSGVARIVDFYNSRHKEEEIVRVSLVGMGAELMGFRDMFREELNMPCHLLTRINRAVLHTRSTEKTLGTFVACVGAGLSTDGFYHEEKGSKAKAKSEVNYGNLSILVILFFLVLSGALSYFAYMSYLEQKLLQTSLEQQKAMYEPGLAAYQDFLDAKTLIGELRKGEELTRHQNDGILNFLRELEEKLPSDIRLKEFGSDDTSVTMTVIVSDKETAAKVIETLRGFESLMQVNVRLVTETSKDDISKAGRGEAYRVLDTEVTFTIEALYLPMSATVEEAASGVTE